MGLDNTVAIVMSFLALVISFSVMVIAVKKFKHDKLEAKRDSLRRLMGYRYRLTDHLKGIDGEPFIVLNEICVVYADTPDVIKQLTKFRKELDSGKLAENLELLTTLMAEAVKISINEHNSLIFERPFTPPKPQIKTITNPEITV